LLLQESERDELDAGGNVQDAEVNQEVEHGQMQARRENRGAQRVEDLTQEEQ